MIKIAVLVEDDFDIIRGQANAELNRIKFLKDYKDIHIDVFSFAKYDGWFTRTIKGKKKRPLCNSKIINGITVNFRWKSYSLVDYILEMKLHTSPIVNKNWTFDFVEEFKEYDILSVHSLICGEFANEIKRVYKIPYCITWHGTDIHTTPFKSKDKWSRTKVVLDNADVNFFVSAKLLETANSISANDNKTVLYNGISEDFFKFDDQTRKKIRLSLNPGSKKIIAFVGNLLPVKNPMSLPDIFRQVYKKYTDIEFWIIGTGEYKNKIAERCAMYNIPVIFKGSIPAEKMPSYYNCIDILVLPSKNEGLPLVTVEALACGSNVVGSNVGGIPEVIGIENCFELDSSFVQSIAGRICTILSNGIDQELQACFSWKESAKKEYLIYNKILESRNKQSYEKNIISNTYLSYK